MRKRPNESWLFYFGRRISALAQSSGDWKYWSNVFAMAGAASLAVAFIQGDPIAFYVGLGFCLYGLRFSRKGDK